MSQKIGNNIELFMGPKEVGAPDDLQQTIIDFIDGAQKYLDIAVQELDNMDIANAIIRARQRKLVVRLVLEGDYLTVPRAQTNPFAATKANGKYVTQEENRIIHGAVLRARINVHSDFNPAIFHQKFIIRDRAELLTGSTNFTDTGTSSNLNHLVIIKDKKVAKTYTNEFKELMQGHFGKLMEGTDVAPTDVTVSDIPVRIAFAPDHNPEMEIMKQMSKAKKQIDFAIFTFSESSGIDDTMLLLRRAGIKITGVMEGMMANQKWAPVDTLLGAGVKLKQVRKNKAMGLGKLHHKLMVIDRQVIIGGSFNYTGPANQLNDENIFILGDLDSTSAASISKQKQLAAFALKEIERINEKHAFPLG
ncbi:MAG: phospholipase [Bacteroidetes bacterium]|nr:MAG: phospholipase [Bacteroidota bacterium]